MMMRRAPILFLTKPSHNRWNARAFTLVEIMIVVAIIAILSVILIPNLLRAQKEQKISRFIHTLKEMETALHWYSAENGDYPPDTTPGLEPAGLSAYLPKNPWAEQTPIGGTWDWDRWGTAIGGAASGSNNLLAISTLTGGSYGDITASDMQAIDERLDNGDLATGQFRQDGTRYSYYLFFR